MNCVLFSHRVYRAAAFVLLVIPATAWTLSRPALEAAEIRVNCGRSAGVIRPLHGVNGGPLNYGETIDLSDAWRELRIPFTRLHDCEWPNPAVVDMHAVFPDLNADPDTPASYHFARTDDYLKAIARTGAGFVYRLGESIEHSPRKHYVAPPADYDKWTAACLGIIRHVNAGWADGTRYQIRYWEIWNEPENRPAMWTGTDADYYRLYTTASRGIKKVYPDLKVGGPAVGAAGEVVDGTWQPTAFMTGFVQNCRETSAPLDFFSWHTYTDNPRLYAIKARAIRKWLNQAGFAETEMHLNEWNYLPINDWSALAPAGQGAAREKWYAEMGGENGAAFISHVLIELQDSPVDVANLFTGDTGPFGLFSRHGQPKKTFYAVKAFAQMLDTPERLSVSCDQSRQPAVLAGINREKTTVCILVSNYRDETKAFDLQVEHIPWPGNARAEVFAVDHKHDLTSIDSKILPSTDARLHCEFESPGVMLIRLQKTSETANSP